MLYDWLTASGPVLAGLACGIAATLLVGFFVLRGVARLDERVGLVIKAAYQNTREINQNTREINGFSNGINRLAMQTEASTQFHRKAHDQQRVLLASLNKQMRHLETLLGQSAARKPDTVDAASKPAHRARSQAPSLRQDGDATATRKDRLEATPFSELFGRARAPANGHTGPSRSTAREAVLLSKLFEQHREPAGETRPDNMARPAATRPAVNVPSELPRKVING